MYRSPRRFRWFRWAVILVGLWAVVGFFVLPRIVKSQLERRLSAELERTVTVGTVKVNPFALSLTLEDFAISERDRQAGFLGWKRLYVNFDAWKSLFGAWVLGDLELDGLRGNVNVGVDGTLNFSDLLAKAGADNGEPRAPAKPARPLRIDRLKVTRAAMAFLDLSRTPEFSTTVGPVTFELKGFRTAGPGESPYVFEAVTEAGERLAWRGSLAAAPFRSAGEFQISDLLLPKYAPYYGQAVRAVVADGKLSVGGRYEIDLSQDGRRLKLSDGAVQVRDLRVLEAGVNEPLLVLPAVDVSGIAADAVAAKVNVARVAVKGGSTGLRREVDGTLNLLRLIGPATMAQASPAPASPAPPTASTPAGPTPDVSVDDVVVDGFAVRVRDLAAARPAQLELNDVKVAVKHFTLAEGAEFPVQVGFDWAPQGAVQLDGTVKLKPAVDANFAVVTTDLALLPLSPYVEQFVRARLTQGAVSTQLRAHLTLPAEGPAATLSGDVTIAKLGLVDEVAKEELAGFESLALKDVQLSTAPKLDVTLGEVALAGPYAQVLVRPDHSLNLATLTAPPPGKVPPTRPSVSLPASGGAGEAAPAEEPHIVINRVTIADGRARFADRSLQPGVTMNVTRFGGTITGLSSENLTKGDVDLTASVDGSGPVSVKGKLDPLGASKAVDLKIDLRNVDLTPLSPYAGKFAGYELARGKLQLDVNFRMKDEALDSANVVTLDQFTWGAATNSPDATKLPVRLGVALLKDVNGKIVLDVPVEGNLNDPEFRVSRVVWRVIGNLLTKAAVSPFALLGSMFGGGGEELAYQQFAPGATELLASEQSKLETMVKALKNRPGLSVAVEGGYDGTVDAYALKRRKFETQLRTHVWEQRQAAGGDVPPPEQLVPTAEERALALKEMFAAAFPEEASAQAAPNAAAATTSAPEPSAPPPQSAQASAEEKGLVKRTWNLLTLKAWREERAAKREAEMRERAEEQRRAEAERLAAQAGGADQPVIGLSIEAMADRLTAKVQVTPDDLRELAADRAKTVRDYFTQAGIAPERVFLAQTEDAAKLNKGPRVTLSLQ